MAGIQKLLDLPIVMHNRQWSPQSDYIKDTRLPFQWLTGPDWTIPADPEVRPRATALWTRNSALDTQQRCAHNAPYTSIPCRLHLNAASCGFLVSILSSPHPLQAFFTWFFQQQQGWGLSMYEQDWMCKEYDFTSALQTNISLADDWLRGMALGAERSGRTVQYCMPYAHDLLSAAAYPAVSNARATGDYFHTPSGHQWAIGATALFYDALNILPFKVSSHFSPLTSHTSDLPHV